MISHGHRKSDSDDDNVKCRFDKAPSLQRLLPSPSGLPLRLIYALEMGTSGKFHWNSLGGRLPRGGSILTERLQEGHLSTSYVPYLPYIHSPARRRSRSSQGWDSTASRHRVTNRLRLSECGGLQGAVRSGDGGMQLCSSYQSGKSILSRIGSDNFVSLSRFRALATNALVSSSNTRLRIIYCRGFSVGTGYTYS